MMRGSFSSYTDPNPNIEHTQQLLDEVRKQEELIDLYEGWRLRMTEQEFDYIIQGKKQEIKVRKNFLMQILTKQHSQINSTSSPRHAESPEAFSRIKPRIHFEEETSRKPSYNVNFTSAKSRPQIKLDLTSVPNSRTEVPETISFDRNQFKDLKETSPAKIFVNPRAQLAIPETKSESARSSNASKGVLFQELEINRRNTLKRSTTKVERTLFDNKFSSFDIPVQAAHIREPSFQCSPKNQSFTENVEQTIENTKKWVEPDQVDVKESIYDFKKLLKGADLISPDASKLTKGFVFTTPCFSRDQPLSNSQKSSPQKPDFKLSNYKEQLEKMKTIEEKIEDDDLVPINKRLSIPSKIEQSRSSETQDTETSTSMSLISNQLCFTPSKNSPKVVISDRSFTPSSNLSRYISPGKSRPSSGLKKKPVTLDAFKSRSKLKTGDFSSKMIPRHSVNKSLPPLDKKISDSGSITSSPSTTNNDRIKKHML